MSEMGVKNKAMLAGSCSASQEEHFTAVELASRWSGGDSSWSTATGGNLQPCTGSAASKVGTVCLLR